MILRETYKFMLIADSTTKRANGWTEVYCGVSPVGFTVT